MFRWPSRLPHEFSSSKIPNEKQWYCFQLEEVSSQNVMSYPDSVVVKKGVGRTSREPPVHTVLLTPCLILRWGRTEAPAEWGVLFEAAAPSYPHPPTKRFHISLNQHFAFHLKFLNKWNWSFDALFILKSNLTPSHTAQMFLHSSYFDVLFTRVMNGGNQGPQRCHCRQPCAP